MNHHAQHLSCQLLNLFTNPHHRTSFQALLSLLLKADGRPHPHHSRTKSASALSRFLNHYPWRTRTLIRTTRRALIHALLHLDEQHRGRRPWLRVLIDLTTLDKRGFFPQVGLIRRYGEQYGLHLVVMYLMFGPWRVPWGFRVYRGQGQPSPSRLALRLLRTLPWVLRERFRIIVLADAGFENQAFWRGVHALGFEAVLGVRNDRVQHDGTPLQHARSGTQVRLAGVPFLVTVARYQVKRGDGRREKRLVLATYATHRKMVTRWGRRRWAIEALFKTLKQRFGWDRFGQGTRVGVYRFLVLGLLAFVLTQFQVWQQQGWPDWQGAAWEVRRRVLAEVVARELGWEWERLRPFLPLEGAVGT